MSGLLNISEMGALALHVAAELTALREENPEARRTVKDIADALNASVHTLQKVTRRLVAIGLLEGTRGANGGLRLRANPKRVTMLQILEGMEGPIRANGCMFANRVCPKGDCRFSTVTGDLERRVRDYFISTTLADLAASAREERVLQPIVREAQKDFP